MDHELITCNIAKNIAVVMMPRSGGISTRSIRNALEEKYIDQDHIEREDKYIRIVHIIAAKRMRCDNPFMSS